MSLSISTHGKEVFMIFLGPIRKKIMFCSVLNRFKFDDERVTKEELKRALEEQYGGEEEVNALMVGYVASCAYL